MPRCGRQARSDICSECKSGTHPCGMPAWLPMDRPSCPCACWGRGDVRLRYAVDALAAVPPTTSTCQIPSLVDVTRGDESGIELCHRYPGLATDPLLGHLPAFLKNKNPSADENPSTGRDESEEDKGDALLVRRWRRARTFDGKQSPLPCAALSRSSDAPRRRLLLASARSFVSPRRQDRFRT